MNEYQMKLSQRVDLPEVGFVRLPTILRVFPVEKSTWWAGIRTGRFPSPVKIGPRTTAWRVEDIRRLIGERDRSPIASTDVSERRR